MGVFIDRLLGFDRKPTDGIAQGLPLTQTDQLFLEVHAATLPTTVPTLQVNVTTFDPASGTSSTRSPVRFLITANDYSLETAATAPAGTFSNGEILTSVTVTSSATVPGVGRCHVSVFLFRSGILFAQLIGDFITNENIPTWIAGRPSHDFKNAFYDVNREGCLFTFQGTVANGAGGAGDQSLTVTPPSGGRMEFISFEIINNDTSARATTLTLSDGAGNVVLHVLQSAGSLAAAAALIYPQLGSVAGTGGNQPNGRCVVLAGSNVLTATVAAVAASQDSAYSFSALVWGGTPTCTLAGASTPTLTTNTSRFETG